MSAPASSYDEVPYETTPRYFTHPDCLATMATLAGMSPAAPDRCRLLELGCATGGNLLPMAEALPQSEFVGFDLSTRQIDMGRTVARAAGVNNVRLEPCGILDIDKTFGTFDYIVCHGVYSWVPAAVRDGILGVCQRHLAPQGVAMVSYNTYPGWHFRAPVREMMQFHVRRTKDLATRTREARGLLQFLAQSVPAPEGNWGRLVRGEAGRLQKESDFYLAHEHLEDTNDAVYFHEFAAHAASHGLQYLGETSNHLILNSLGPKVQEMLRPLANDLLLLEQYVDFLKGRSFRRTLLARADVLLQRSPNSAIVERLLFSCLARPVTPGGDVCSNAALEFRNEDEASLKTNIPVTKAALLRLHEAHPQAVSFSQLWENVCARLQAGGASVPEDAKTGLCGALIQLFLSGLVGMHCHVPSFTSVAGENPEATPLARFQARQGTAVVNRRHQSVKLVGLDAALLTLLDGRLDRSALAEGLAHLVREGKFELCCDGKPVHSADTTKILRDELDGALQRLAGAALLLR